jgi:hypothetical protein
LVFCWSQGVLAYSFLSSWVVWLRFPLFFSFIFYFIFELWDSVFQLF